MLTFTVTHIFFTWYLETAPHNPTVQSTHAPAALTLLLPNQTANYILFSNQLKDQKLRKAVVDFDDNKQQITPLLKPADLLKLVWLKVPFTLVGENLKDPKSLEVVEVCRVMPVEKKKKKKEIKDALNAKPIVGLVCKLCLIFAYMRFVQTWGNTIERSDMFTHLLNRSGRFNKETGVIWCVTISINMVAISIKFQLLLFALLDDSIFSFLQSA